LIKLKSMAAGVSDRICELDAIELKLRL
jgi:hypothetical protein